ncbi:hypothetical protein O6H91_Y479400 [Diphasiastrum complanatum]|nr:hypothetical protein O6H91_Y479400 [Diphasiastrum complanatum]
MVRVIHRQSGLGLCVDRMEEGAKELGTQDEEILNESKFTKRMQVHAVSVPKHMSQIAARILSGYVLDMPRVKHIVPDPADDSYRLILLSDAITTSSLDGVPEEKLTALRKLIDVKVVLHEMVLDYTYWPVEYILKAILPDRWEVPTSFETIGHIAHLNLRDELLPYRKVIAKVILDKNRPKIKTVVNKVSIIDNEFRVPALEILGGENSLITEVKQQGATFKLDYGLVYWNSRLEHEHNRLISQFKKGQVVIDMFAGIGPFAILAARRGCIVYANDLNPDSVKYLEINAKINKVASGIFPHNMDARHFMQKLMKNFKFLFDDFKNEITAADNIELKIPQIMATKVEPIWNECPTEDRPCVSARMEIGCGLKIGTVVQNADSAFGNVSSSILDPAMLNDTASCPGITSSSTEQDALIGQESLLSCENGRNAQGKPSEYRDMSRGHKMPTSNVEVQERDEVNKPWEHFDHAIMNLPASAIEFLGVFQGLMSREYWRGPMPRVHCYCFMRSSESKEDIIQRAERIMRGRIRDPCLHTVRDVAPNKTMLCLSFQLPESVAFQETAVESMYDVDACKLERSTTTDTCDMKRARVV